MEDRNVIEQLKDNLVPYLASQGIKVSAAHFSCFTGKHADTSPSCHVIKESRGRVWYCFGCMTGGDVFHAARFLEKKNGRDLPLEGPEFWRETVDFLAKQFKVPYSPGELTPEEKERYEWLALYRDAADYVLGSLNNPAASIHQALATRGWTVETAKGCSIGCVDDHKLFVDHLMSLGWSRDTLFKGGLLDERIFSARSSMIFVIRNGNGKPVAFSARLREIPANENIGKYINSNNSIIYQKSAALYLFDQARLLDGALWLVEGYADAVTLWQAGVKRVCAIGSTHFTGPEEGGIPGQNHLEMLLAHNITNVILCLDGDPAGHRGIERAITEHFPKAPNILVRICEIPDGGDDPDSFVRASGIEAFKKLLLITPFRWQLNRVSGEEELTKVTQRMIPVIAAEPNSITRATMCRDLALKTGISQPFIEEAVLNTTNTDRAESRGLVFSNIKELQRRLTTVTDPEVAASLLLTYTEKVNGLVERETIRKTYTYSERIAAVRNAVLDPTTGYRLKMGKFKQLESALGGLPTNGNLIYLTGIPNIGKTSFLRDLSWELMRSNEDARILFMTIDDGLESVLNGYVALHTAYDKDFIENKPRLFADAIRKEAVWKAFDTMEKMKDKLTIYDIIDGNSLRSLERHITHSLLHYPDKKLVVVLDSFNDLAEYVAANGEEGAISAVSSRIKGIATKYNVPVIVNAQMKKNEWRSKPTLLDMKGSRAMEYHGNLVMILHQALHMDDATRMVWNAGEGYKPQPINELIMAKNKISAYKGNIYLKFHTHRSIMDEASPMWVSPIIEQERQRQLDIWRKKSEYKSKSRWNQDDAGGETDTPGTEGSGT